VAEDVVKDDSVEEEGVASDEEEVVSEEEEDVEEEEEEEVPAGPEPWSWGLGRRKTAIARIRIRSGSGRVIVNKKPLDEYFCTERLRRRAVEPLKTVKLEGRVDVFANIKGGGTTGQAEAMLMGLARAILKYDETSMAVLRTSGHLTRDSRMVERKKYGRRGARASFQFSKR
jgi:small subunit ribosomal protein S9